MNQFFTFNKTTRKWHLPVIAGLCVGIPIMAGYFSGNTEGGKLASLSGLVILYIQSNNIPRRMMILMTCCLGIMLSFTFGLFFSFSNLASPIALAVFSFFIHYSIYKLGLTKPPGNFFFIMLASVAICMPYQPGKIPERTGYIAMGAMLSCLLGLVYSLLTLRGKEPPDDPVNAKDRYTNIVESITYGVFIGLSLAIANALELDNPYWAPVSCAAVMQGVSTKHIWMRGTQRILGTLLGLGLTWGIVLLHPSPLIIAVSIVALQVIVEFLVVRNYGIAVVFITILTIFLAESGSRLAIDTNELFVARLIDIILGSAIGAIGGWVLFNERVHYLTTLQIRKAKILIRKNKMR
ncbi:MAG: FUSC family protein [Chitinophagaceae bacterium]|nr:FUSC family protein [Chitinophagaceae bacterium]